MAVSFIDGGNQRKPLTCRKSLTNYSIMFYWVHLAWVGFKLTTLVVIGIDCIGSCKSNYHMITTTTTPWEFGIHSRRGALDTTYCAKLCHWFASFVNNGILIFSLINMILRQVYITRLSFITLLFTIIYLIYVYWSNLSNEMFIFFRQGNICKNT